MHSKRLGTLGELKVATYLCGLGLSVFLELGDISKKDLIVEHEGKLLGVQVKAITKTDGVYRFKASKSGPNYKFDYTEEDCDIFALYCVDDDAIAWLRSSEVTGENKYVSLRAEETKNNQTEGVRWLKDYTDVNRVLGR